MFVAKVKFVEFEGKPASYWRKIFASNANEEMKDIVDDATRTPGDISFSAANALLETKELFADLDEKGNILVAITENDEIWIDKRRVDLKAVRANIERLKIEYPEGSVIIQADQRSRSGLLVEAMDQIRLAGVTNISIAAKNDN